MLQIYLYLSLNVPAVVLAHRRRNTCILITEFSVELIRKNWLFFKPVYCALPYCWECSYVNKCCRINYKEMAQLVEECREEIITPSGYCEWEVSKCSAFCYSELTYCTGSGTRGIGTSQCSTAKLTVSWYVPPVRAQKLRLSLCRTLMKHGTGWLPQFWSNTFSGPFGKEVRLLQSLLYMCTGSHTQLFWMSPLYVSVSLEH